MLLRRPCPSATTTGSHHLPCHCLSGCHKAASRCNICPVPALQPLTYCEEEEEHRRALLSPTENHLSSSPSPPFQVPPGRTFDDKSPSHLAGGQSRPWRHSPHCMRRGVLGFVGESGGRMAGRRGDEAAAARVNEIPASKFPPRRNNLLETRTVFPFCPIPSSPPPPPRPSACLGVHPYPVLGVCCSTARFPPPTHLPTVPTVPTVLLC